MIIYKLLHLSKVGKDALELLCLGLGPSLVVAEQTVEVDVRIVAESGLLALQRRHRVANWLPRGGQKIALLDLKLNWNLPTFGLDTGQIYVFFCQSV